MGRAGKLKVLLIYLRCLMPCDDFQFLWSFEVIARCNFLKLGQVKRTLLMSVKGRERYVR